MMSQVAQGPSRESGDRRFPRRVRLRLQADFARVFAAEAVAADGVLVLYSCPNQQAFSRLGLSVSRKVGSAVVRNRWKRLIREAFRQSRLPAGFDFVARPRRGASPEARAILASLPQLAHRLARRWERGRP